MPSDTFAELQSSCTHRRNSQVTRRRGNHLNVEYFGGGTYCMLQSPDGRGSVWLLSGGDIEAYGQCFEYRCPLMKEGSP